MLILDTNHYSMAEAESSASWRLRDRLRRYGDLHAVTVITEAEVLRGRLAQINAPRQKDRGMAAYRLLQESVEQLGSWLVLPWTEDAADIFDSLAHLRTKVGALDLRIASIALEYQATVLTRNLVDFEKVPGLRVENWLD